MADPALPAALLKSLASSHTEASSAPVMLSRLTTDDVSWLTKQGVASYLYVRLRDTGSHQYLDSEVLATLRRVYAGNALREALQYQEATTRVLAALHQAGVQTVLMKGMALACTVYTDPRSRPKSDLDIWIPLDQRMDAIAALEQVGYYSKEKESRPAALRERYGGEQQMVSRQPGSGLVELQWPAIRGEWVRRATNIDHDAIWQRRIPIEVEGQPTSVMAMEDMLLHVCVHHAINHSFGQPWLRALLDVHLLCQQELDWDAVVRRARRWRIATLAWTTLGLATTMLGTSVPDTVRVGLAPPWWQQAAIKRLRLAEATLEMWPMGVEHRRFVIQTLMADRARDAGRLLWDALFPEQEWLQARYGTDSTRALWRARVLHPLKVIFTAKA